jgi:hypothetical protein
MVRVGQLKFNISISFAFVVLFVISYALFFIFYVTFLKIDKINEVGLCVFLCLS